MPSVKYMECPPPGFVWVSPTNNSYIYLKEYGTFEIAILLIYVTKECFFHKNKLSTKPKFAKGSGI